MSMFGVSERAEDGDVFVAGLEWKEWSAGGEGFVAEKDGGALGGEAGGGAVGGIGEHLNGAGNVDVGMLEEAETKFHLEDGANGGVELGRR